MKINRTVIEKLKPCKDKFDNYSSNHGDKDYNLEQFLELDNITYSDKVWVVTKLFTHEQNVKWSIACVESVLYIFENQHPNDKRPRKAIEAAKQWLLDPTEENRIAANDACLTSYANPDICAIAYANPDANPDASAIAYAAYAIAYAAANPSAYAAAYTYAAAIAAAPYTNQQNLNLLFMLEVTNV